MKFKKLKRNDIERNHRDLFNEFKKDVLLKTCGQFQSLDSLKLRVHIALGD